MEVTNIDKVIFHEVKEQCVELSQISFLPPEVAKTSSSSKRMTSALQNLYNCLNSSVIKHTQLQHMDRLVLNNKLADYIFVPISYLLKQQESFTDLQVELICKLINILIDHCWYYPINSSPKLFSQLFPLFVYLLDEEKTGKPISVESKIAGVNCLYSLSESLTVQKSPFFEEVKNLPLLGQLITLALDFSLLQDSIVLQSKSLQLLSHLYTNVLNNGEVLSHILPGNVSKLTKLIAQKDGITTHYSILVIVLDMLSFLITKIFNDVDLKVIDRKQDISSLEDLVQLANDVSRPKSFTEPRTNHSLIVIPETSAKQHRTTTWLQATSHQIKRAIPIILSLKGHRKFDVRSHLLQFCISVVASCSKSLEILVPLLVDCVSFLNNDVSLQTPIQEWMATEHALDNVIRAKLETKISLLPSSLSSSDQEKIVADLNSLSFYLYHSREENPFMVENFVHTFHQSLVSYIEAEMSTKRFKSRNIQVTSGLDSISNDLMLVQKSYNDSIEVSNNSRLLEKFYDSEVEDALSKMLQKLGENSQWLQTVSATLLASEQSSFSRALSIWIINNMMIGYSSKAEANVTNVVDEFLVIEEAVNDDVAELFVSETIYSVMEVANELIEEFSNSEVDSVGSLIQSIGLDCIGLSSLVLKDLFKDELIDYLYPVIDSLASSSDQIREHAQRAAIMISNECYNGSLRDLIYENCDYLTDSLSLKLTSDTITPRTSAVLLVLIKVGGMELVAQLHDIVNTMFTLLDLYHGYDSLSEGFFVVFNTIIDQVFETYLKNYDFAKETKNVENYDKPWGMTCVDQVLDLIDTKKRDLEINLEGKEIPLVKHPNTPFGEVPDSDDEADEEDNDKDELALMKEMDNYQIEKAKEENAKWDSHIPSNLYYLIEQMLSYGDRIVLSTDSVRLQSRILEVFGKVFPILATSQKNLYPILADLWPLVLNLCTDDDIRVVTSAVVVAHNMINFGGDFMSKKFGELWISIKEDSKVWQEFSRILNITRTGTNSLTKGTSRFEDNVNFKVYSTISEMLLLGIRKLGNSLPNKLVEEIINDIITLFPDIESYGCFKDIAWLVKFEKLGTIEMEKPDNVIFDDGKEFCFGDLSTYEGQRGAKQ